LASPHPTIPVPHVDFPQVGIESLTMHAAPSLSVPPGLSVTKS
jgi:hypothetical protein